MIINRTSITNMNYGLHFEPLSGRKKMKILSDFINDGIYLAGYDHESLKETSDD